MLGIYIHIPFCVKKCDYCDFYSVPAIRGEIPNAEYLRAIRGQLREDAAAHGLAGRGIGSVYFGGGTPSLMPASFFEDILNDLLGIFSFDENIEISCETNPATVDLDWFHGVRACGVTRAVVGVQTFNERLLSTLGRIHTAEDAMRALAEALDAGFRSVGLDLIYGIPGEAISDLEEDIKTALMFQPQHISAYQLTVEDGTPLHEKIMSGSLRLPDEDAELKQMRLVVRVLGRAGLRRYEISNFAKAGFECAHNINYWRYGECLGLGAAATSFVKINRGVIASPAVRDEAIPRASRDCFVVPFNGTPRNDTGILHARRWTCVRDLHRYMQGTGVAEVEDIRVPTAMSEFCFMGLRMMDGISRDDFRREFGVEFDAVYRGACARLVGEGLICDDGERLSLTDRGVEISNRVFEDFIEPHL